jgi:hypothetical protein
MLGGGLAKKRIHKAVCLDGWLVHFNGLEWECSPQFAQEHQASSSMIFSISACDMTSRDFVCPAIASHLGRQEMHRLRYSLAATPGRS